MHFLSGNIVVFHIVLAHASCTWYYRGVRAKALHDVTSTFDRFENQQDTWTAQLENMWNFLNDE